ncbi:EAL domain-containing protein [Acidihalobacter prosperus]
MRHCYPAEWGGRLKVGDRRFWGLALPLVVVLAWGGWVEMSQYRQAQAEVAQAAQNSAGAYATRIADSLSQHFAELQVIALSMLGADFNPRDVSPPVTQRLYRYLQFHPHLRVVVIQSADGRVRWPSLRDGAQWPIASAGYTPVTAHVDDMVGHAGYDSSLGGYVLPIRYRVRSASGALEYYVGMPFQLESFLMATHVRTGWTLSVVDVRDGSVLGEVDDSGVRFPRQVRPTQGVVVPVPGYPFSVQANWTPQRAVHSYMQTAPARWVLELITAVLLMGGAASLLLALRQRDRHAQRLRYLVDFSALRTQVNQAAARVGDDRELLQHVCDAAVSYGHLALAWIGQPGEGQTLRYLAVAGASDYLESGPISVSENVPEGLGPAGVAWRRQRPVFGVPPRQWQAHAQRFNLRTVAVLPLRRDGAVWAVLALYHSRLEGFDEDLKSLLEDLAGDVSHGLDRLDAQLRERRLSEQLAKTRDYHRALFEHNAAGMCIVNEQRLLVEVNRVFCEYLGYSEQELLGQSTAILYVNEEEFRDFDPERVTTEGGFSFYRQELRLRCKDGSYLWAQVLGAPIQLPDDGAGLLWSFIDVTALHVAQQEIAYQALHDVLTDLPNRRALEQFLPQAIARAKRGMTAVAVGVIDLDDFKPVNERLGHESGDALLKEFGARLLPELRQSDFLARLGGDEFVIVFDELNEMYVVQHLCAVMERLRRVVERSFELGEGRTVEIGMSMGVAVFPFDAEDGGALLRKADAAMYEAKTHKHQRGEWWKLSSASAALPMHETVFEPYGEEASLLLDKMRDRLAMVADAYVETFFSDLALDGALHAILGKLDQGETQKLMQSQKEQLLFLTAPDTSREVLEQRARHLGQIHALVGVNAGLLAKAQALYSRLLSDHLSRILMPAQDRYRLMLTVETRLQDDVQLEFEAQDETIGAYVRSLSEALPQPGSAWVDARRGEAALLGNLPGLRGAALMRPDAEGVFAVEESAGPVAVELGDLLQWPDAQAETDAESHSTQGHMLCAQAWRTQTIISVPSLVQDQDYEVWHERLRTVGVRSALAVPIMSDAGHSVAVIMLYGAFPNQFEPPWMRDFARSLQQRWAQVWFRCSTLAPPISQDRAQELRQRLFGGGLRMYMQPIVDLRSGSLAKVEALARLEMPDGEIVSPGVFLPLLGDVELDMLFRLGLDMALEQLGRWDARGLSVGLSVNLSPGSLLAAECPRWIEDALQRHGIEAGRLTLELLETQYVDRSARDSAITRLIDIGVKLALDDLGAGYSSLERLAAMPFDTIKVDQGLLSRIYAEPLQTLSLVRAIVQIGRDFERDVVIEGLEVPALIEAAAILGARYGQGYELARPMPADEIPAWLQAFARSPMTSDIHTFVGALAFHWQFMHDASTHYPSSVESCPLSGFIAERGLEQSEAAQLHARIHAGIDVVDNSHRLTDWLVEQVRIEMPAVSGGQANQRA